MMEMVKLIGTLFMTEPYLPVASHKNKIKLKNKQLTHLTEFTNNSELLVVPLHPHY